MQGSTVGTVGLLRAPASEALQTIRVTLRDAGGSYQTGDTIELPMPAVLTTAIKRCMRKESGIGAREAQLLGSPYGPLQAALDAQRWAKEVVRNRKGEKAMTADRSDNTPQEVTADSHVARLFAWRRGFNAMHLIDLGLRLGLFKAFAHTPNVTAGQVADRLGLHAPYVDVWCTTAYSFELLEVDEERRFCLAPFVNAILANPAHPRYLGGYVRLGTAFATEDYRLAPEAFRTGRTVPF